MRLPKPIREARAPKPLRRQRRKRSRVPRGLADHRAAEKIADDLWSRIVRARSVMCERCHLRPVHDAHHMVSRTYRQTRWLVDVGAALCRNCHRIVGMDGEENRLLAHDLVGAERWEQLQVTKHCRGKVDPKAAAVMLRYEAEKRGLDLIARLEQ